MRGASRGGLGVGWIAAPAGGVRTPALGRPWVAVRAHYGALPSMAGRRCGRRRGESRPAEGVDPLSHIRKHGPGDRKAACGAPRGARGPKGSRHETKRTRLAALHTPHFLRGESWEDGLPGAAKNTGAFACLLSSSCPAIAVRKNGVLTNAYVPGIHVLLAVCESRGWPEQVRP